MEFFEHYGYQFDYKHVGISIDGAGSYYVRSEEQTKKAHADFSAGRTKTLNVGDVALFLSAVNSLDLGK